MRKSRIKKEISPIRYMIPFNPFMPYIKMGQWNTIALDFRRDINDRFPKLEFVNINKVQLSEPEVKFIGKGIAKANIDRLTVN